MFLQAQEPSKSKSKPPKKVKKEPESDAIEYALSLTTEDIDALKKPQIDAVLRSVNYAWPGANRKEVIKRLVKWQVAERARQAKQPSPVKERGPEYPSDPGVVGLLRTVFDSTMEPAAPQNVDGPSNTADATILTKPSQSPQATKEDKQKATPAIAPKVRAIAPKVAAAAKSEKAGAKTEQKRDSAKQNAKKPTNSVKRSHSAMTGNLGQGNVAADATGVKNRKLKAAAKGPTEPRQMSVELGSEFDNEGFAVPGKSQPGGQGKVAADTKHVKKRKLESAAKGLTEPRQMPVESEWDSESEWEEALSPPDTPYGKKRKLESAAKGPAEPRQMSVELGFESWNDEVRK